MMEITEKDINKIRCLRCMKEILPTMTYGFTGKGGYCLDCWIALGYGRPILDHSYRPTPTFCHMSTEKDIGKRKLLYMGIELEVENKTIDLVRYAYSLQKEYSMYIKHDGSLVSGLEIVSHPQTLRYHQRVFNWYKLLEKLREDKFTSYDNGRCGLHIHVNKNFFNSRDDILKVVLFFYKCFNRIKWFAKRRDRDCAEFCKRWKQSLVDYVEKSKGSVEIAENNDDRYSCINLQNYDTMEFRIYRGTLNYNRFLASLLFTDAICHFVKSYSIVFFSNKEHKMSVLWDKFVEYITINERYSFLKKYFQKHDLEKPKIKPLIPSHEDYIGKKKAEDVKVSIVTIDNLYDICKDTGLESHVINALHYEFIESDFNMVDLKSGFYYYAFYEDDPNNTIKWILSHLLPSFSLYSPHVKE